MLGHVRTDTLFVLLVFLGLQFVIPSRLVVAGMGSAGHPAVAVGIGLAFLWLLCAVRPGRLPGGVQPVRWLLLAFLLVNLAGYAVGFDRGLPPVESRSADRWIIVMVSTVGVGLAVADGIRTRRQLDVLLKAVVYLSAFMAVVGILQFFRIVDLTRYIRLPGLTANSDLIGVGSRGSANIARVAGTANHYIEFGVVLALVLPLALHLALCARRGKRILPWGAVVLIASAVPLSISRAAVVTALVSMVVLAVVWSWRLRYNVLVLGILGVLAFHVVNRGVLGTIRSLFTRAGNDPSIQNRLSDTEYVMAMWAERPWFGRGVGTVMPDRYILLDNQIYGTLLAGGLLGLAAFFLLFAVPYLLARSLRLKSADQETRHLAQVLAAMSAAAVVASATFDSLSFSTFTAVAFVVVGATGALWRLERGDPRRSLQPGTRLVNSPLMLAITAASRPRHRRSTPEGWDLSARRGDVDR